MSTDLIVAFAIFIASVAVVIGLGLFVLTMVLRVQARHRKRLARVGRKRMSGRLDLDDARLMLRQKKQTNALVTLTEAFARVLPLLDTARLRANFRRACTRRTMVRTKSPRPITTATEAMKIAKATIRSVDIPSPPGAGCQGRSTRPAA